MKCRFPWMLPFVCALCLAGCGQGEFSAPVPEPPDIPPAQERGVPLPAREPESEGSANTLVAEEYTVAEVGRGTLKTAVALSEEDAEFLMQIMEDGSWNEAGTADCANNCVLQLKGRLVYYHSDCGTFNEFDLSGLSPLSSQAPAGGGRCLSLTPEARAAVNAVLEQYITLRFTALPEAE